MELLIMIDACKRASAGRITAVMPYYGYGRTDKKDQPRVPITARLVADLLTAAGADRVLTVDLHAPQYFADKGIDDLVVVAVDIGISKKARDVAERLSAPLAIIEKRRTDNSGESELMNVIGEVEGKVALTFDDEIDTGGTVVNAAKALLDHGVKEVYCCASHPVLSRNAPETMAQSPFTEIVVTDTIPISPDKRNGKITVLADPGERRVCGAATARCTGDPTRDYLRQLMPDDDELRDLIALAEEECLSELVDDEDEGTSIELHQVNEGTDDTYRGSQSKRQIYEHQHVDTLRRSEQRLEQEQRTLADCQAAAKEAQDRVPASPPPLDANALERRRAALRNARGRLNEYERARQSRETLVGQLNALIAGHESSDASSSAAPNPLATAVSRQVSDAEALEASAWRLLVEAAAPLGIDGDPTGAALDSTEARLETLRTALSTWNDAKEKVDEAKRRLEEQERRVEAAAASLTDANKSREAARSNWVEWLGQHGLPTSFTPDTVVEFLGHVETTRVKMEQVGDNRRRVSAIEFDIRQFRERVEPLALRHDVQVDSEDSSKLALAADELIRRLDEAETAYHSRERNREQAEEDRQLLEGRKRRLESAEEDLSALLTAGGTDDTEEFRRRARLDEERGGA
ncbi:Ribose-phosphate pyrophosphokinase [Geodia barretti]|uniref:Ribose-phosphate pyrophosphokinase n=1 Tax=Geodia barretti TaxID=519541 RepID=A0AA35T1U9_GEOBA|nr:Ribose-phosphate pyrophosphokinase [Geodia barretti]